MKIFNTEQVSVSIKLMTDDGPTTPSLPPTTLEATTESTSDTEEAAMLSERYALGEEEAIEVEKIMKELEDVQATANPRRWKHPLNQQVILRKQQCCRRGMP